jgi:predicted signal transduction protein with EAL and GGDEF domain
VPRVARRGLTLSIAVNLSTRNLLDIEFPTEVQELLERWQVDPRCSSSRSPSRRCSPTRCATSSPRALSAMGIRLSIDDFGTGYSSLAYLKRPAGRRDQDRPLVRHEHGPQRGRRDDRALDDRPRPQPRPRGRRRGRRDRGVWDTLQRSGCTVAQGYYLSRPVPPASCGRGSRRGAPRARRPAHEVLRPRRTRRAARRRRARPPRGRPRWR